MTSGDAGKDFDLMPLLQKEAQPLAQGCQSRSFIQKGLSLLFSKAGGSNTCFISSDSPQIMILFHLMH